MRVELVDYRFIPDHLTFRHGVTYRLHLENHGKDLHEFTAPAFFAEAIVRDPGKLANGGQEVVVQPGETADIDLVPQRAGPLRPELRRSRLGRHGRQHRRAVEGPFGERRNSLLPADTAAVDFANRRWTAAGRNAEFLTKLKEAR